jgi:23S rRNA (cytidine1920-2'-O)/16S rRNA (cytidine1409-2'-O)-methyltransferase
MAKRLDIYLAESGLADTRSKAQQLIKSGYVVVNHKVCKKSALLIDDNDKIEIKDSPFVYVSRAGVKLKHAIDVFGIDLDNKICLDVGASTGGFSDCMLKEGARLVYAVDVGSNQLHESLKKNPKIFSFENTDIRRFEQDILCDFIAIDVSFISLKHVLPYAKRFLKDNGVMVALIKPQFEVGAGCVKKGIVRDKSRIKSVLEDIQQYCIEIGLKPENIIESPIKGKEGNVEYLILLSNKEM